MKEWWEYVVKCECENRDKNTIAQELEGIKQELKEIKIILASK